MFLLFESAAESTDEELKYIHPEVFCFFLITSIKLKGICHETYHMIAKVNPVKFGGVW